MDDSSCTFSSDSRKRGLSLQSSALVTSPQIQLVPQATERLSLLLFWTSGEIMGPQKRTKTTSDSMCWMFYYKILFFFLNKVTLKAYLQTCEKVYDFVNVKRQKREWVCDRENDGCWFIWVVDKWAFYDHIYHTMSYKTLINTCIFYSFFHLPLTTLQI